MDGPGGRLLLLHGTPLTPQRRRAVPGGAGPGASDRPPPRHHRLLKRFLPAPPARVLDIDGANGVYASRLSGRGYQVHLIDPVPLHREQAMADGRFSVASGDARDLAEDDGSYDVVPLLGPLYHVTDRTDRVGALAEARRVTRPGGIVAAAVISKYASTFDG